MTTRMHARAGTMQLPIGSIFGHHHLNAARQQNAKPLPVCISAAEDAIRESELRLAVGAKEDTSYTFG